MDLGIKELSITSKDKGQTKEQTMKTSVFISPAFAIGILAEGFSSKHVESPH